MIPIPLLYPIFMSGIDLSVMPLLKAKYLGFLDGKWILPVTMILYSLQPIIFFFGLSVNTMGILNVLWNTISSILIAGIGILFFNEKISYNKAFGIILCIIGIAFLSIN